MKLVMRVETAITTVGLIFFLVANFGSESDIVKDSDEPKTFQSWSNLCDCFMPPTVKGRFASISVRLSQLIKRRVSLASSK